MATPTNLDELPVKDGFRLRGIEMTRLETFTDAAFAFALTLLVISFEPPRNVEQLLLTLRAVPSFLCSAALLMMFWWAHHEWSRRFGLDDGPTVIMSFLLVITVLIYVVPLRFMFGMMFTFVGVVTGLPIGEPSMDIDNPGDVNVMFAVYGLGFSAMSLAVLMLNRRALRKRDELRLSPREVYDTETEMGAWWIVTGTGALSTVVALIDPPAVWGLPGWVYMILPVATPWYATARERSKPEDQATPATPAS